VSFENGSPAGAKEWPTTVYDQSCPKMRPKEVRESFSLWEKVARRAG